MSLNYSKKLLKNLGLRTAASQPSILLRTGLAELPPLLLGLRNAISKHTGASAAQAVFGRQLIVPGCIFEGIFDVDSIPSPKRSFFRRDSYVPEDLKTCAHVWIRRLGLVSSVATVL